jgi:hypothetical protein
MLIAQTSFSRDLNSAIRLDGGLGYLENFTREVTKK